ncbi:hypothetical protein F52700_8952 [Fusarium sp. NRRL 52700]|nr:hypothetical protein F52700_8952 [Fusarium sp. NRRL 52700]
MRLHNSQLGDAYQDNKKDEVKSRLRDDGEDWEGLGNRGPYFNYVKSLSKRWPQLELLHDFMEVGTVPTRWCIFPGEEKEKKEQRRYTYDVDIGKRREQQEKRATKMNVALLEFKDDGQIQKDPNNNIGTPDDLRTATKKSRNPGSDVKFSLFVVEDLSRDVIETLGSELAIDPRFFRAHITDYAWNNIRDRWREPSILQVDAKRQTWFQLRLIRSRYFENQDQLTRAKAQVNEFNVMRRLDADKNQIFWDKNPDPTMWERLAGGYSEDKDGMNGRVDAKVGHMRSRATFWLHPESTIGVLLLEPTPEAGYPLWRGYPNWDELPASDTNDVPPDAVRDPQIPPSLRSKDSGNSMSWFEDYIFWAQRTENFAKLTDSGNQALSIPIQCLLHLVCGEWLTFADYLNARLNQIDWGIINPSFFPESGGTDHQKQSLRKLHFWRRWVPQARDMLQATMNQVIDDKDKEVEKSFKLYEDDLEIIKKRLEDYETRIDRLSTVVNSTISLTDASNTSKLTILASFFIPPSLVAALLSMNMDPLIGLGDTLKWWAVASFVAVTILFTIGYLLKTKKSESLKKNLSITKLISKLEERWRNGAWPACFSAKGKILGNSEDDEHFALKAPRDTAGRSENLEPLTDDMCLVATPWLKGFDLKAKDWAQFHADDLTPVAEKQLAWEFVENKTLTHTFGDFVQDKGRGIIIPMFGPPGVGKTYTAEAVAEKARVPLYSMSAGDLGTVPKEVELALERALTLCGLWNAMILLDEADVFLGARSDSDIARNELVAIFLTKLEYYTGVCFLTTNRTASIDIAFQSRVDLFLPYKDLTFEARKKVWKNFINRAGGTQVEIPEDDMDKLAEMKLNGREIKNLIKSAHLLGLKNGGIIQAERLLILAQNRVAALDELK